MITSKLTIKQEEIDSKKQNKGISHLIISHVETWKKLFQHFFMEVRKK